MSEKYIQEKLEYLKVEETQAQGLINELNSKSKQVERNASRAVKQVNDFTNQLMKVVEHSKIKLLQDIYRLRKILLEKAKKERNSQELRIKNIQKTRESLNKHLKYSRGDCKEQTVDSTLSHVMNKNKSPYFDPTIRFDPNEEAFKLQLLNCIGTANIIEEADSSKCFLEELHSKYEAFSIVKLCLRTNTDKGTPCIVLKHMVHVEVRPQKHVSNLEIVEGPLGIIHLSFVPRISGKLALNVRINDNEVKNNPSSVLIEPKTLKTKRKITLREAGLKSPCGIAVSPNFTKLAVTDVDLHCIAIFTSAGTFIKKIGRSGTREGRLSYPDGLAFLNDHEVAVADRDNHRVQIFDINTGQYVRCVGKKSRIKKQFNSPWGVSVDDQNQIIVSDTYNRRLQIFSSRGEKLVREYSFGKHENTILPSRTLSYKNYLIVADALDNNLHIIDQNEGPVVAIDTKGSCRDSLIETLNGVAMDRDANIAVCDGGCIKLFTLEGHFIGKTDTKMNPIDVASLPDGSLLVIDGISGSLLVVK